MLDRATTKIRAIRTEIHTIEMWFSLTVGERREDSAAEITLETLARRPFRERLRDGIAGFLLGRV